MTNTTFCKYAKLCGFANVASFSSPYFPSACVAWHETQKELEKKDGAVILLRSRLSSSSSTSEKDFEEKDREISILEKKLASCKLKLEAAKKEKEIVTEEKNALAAEKNALAADKMLLTRMINKLLTSAEKERDEPLW